jgi:hypothetical protein
MLLEGPNSTIIHNEGLKFALGRVLIIDIILDRPIIPLISYW